MLIYGRAKVCGEEYGELYLPTRALLNALTGSYSFASYLTWSIDAQIRGIIGFLGGRERMVFFPPLTLRVVSRSVDKCIVGRIKCPY